MPTFHPIPLGDLRKVLTTYGPSWERISFAGLVVEREDTWLPLSLLISSEDVKTEPMVVHGTPGLPRGVSVFKTSEAPRDAAEMIERIFEKQPAIIAEMRVAFDAVDLGRAAFLGSSGSDHLFPREFDRLTGEVPKIFFEGSLGSREELIERWDLAQAAFAGCNSKFPSLQDACHRLIGFPVRNGYLVGTIFGVLGLPVKLRVLSCDKLRCCEVEISEKLPHLSPAVRGLVTSDRGSRYEALSLSEPRRRGSSQVSWASIPETTQGVFAELELRLAGHLVESVPFQLRQPPSERSTSSEPERPRRPAARRPSKKPQVSRVRSGRKRKRPLLEQVTDAIRSVHDLDKLQESDLARHPEVKSRADPRHAMAEGRALRELLLEAARLAIQDLEALPRNQDAADFLRMHLKGKSVTEIAQTLGITREWASRGPGTRAFTLACEWFVKAISR